MVDECTLITTPIEFSEFAIFKSNSLDTGPHNEHLRHQLRYAGNGPVLLPHGGRSRCGETEAAHQGREREGIVLRPEEPQREEGPQVINSFLFPIQSGRYS